MGNFKGIGKNATTATKAAGNRNDFTDGRMKKWKHGWPMDEEATRVYGQEEPEVHLEWGSWRLAYKEGGEEEEEDHDDDESERREKLKENVKEVDIQQ